jgi:hypothetical protein
MQVNSVQHSFIKNDRLVDPFREGSTHAHTKTHTNTHTVCFSTKCEQMEIHTTPKMVVMHQRICSLTAE